MINGKSLFCLGKSLYRREIVVGKIGMVVSVYLIVIDVGE